jgi:hypothetical protein
MRFIDFVMDEARRLAWEDLSQAKRESYVRAGAAALVGRGVPDDLLCRWAEVPAKPKRRKTHSR